MIYATKQVTDANEISEGATISAFATRAEAEAFLGVPRTLDDAHENIALPGDFGAFWIRSNRPIAADDLRIAPFGLADLTIIAPGQHPEGKDWLVTPNVDVLVAGTVEMVELDHALPGEDDGQSSPIDHRYVELHHASLAAGRFQAVALAHIGEPNLARVEIAGRELINALKDAGLWLTTSDATAAQ